MNCSTQITRIRKRLDDIEARVEELEKEKQIAISGSFVGRIRWLERPDVPCNQIPLLCANV